jgi:hypothetical protein
MSGSEAPIPGPTQPNNVRSWLPRALLESLLVVLSVLLALALDEWRDQRARRARTEAALQSIAEEFRQNHQLVTGALANHRAMYDSLRQYVGRNELPPERVYLGGLFRPAPVHSTAWESAKETGATSEMPYALVLMLSRVYDRQARYRALGDALGQDLMSEIRREGVENVLRDRPKNFMSLQQDFANRESALLQAYDDALASLSERADTR